MSDKDESFLKDLPPELQAEALAIARRQAIEASMINRMSPGSAGAGRRLADQYGDRMGDLSRRYQSGLQGAVQDYMMKKQGGTFNRPTAEVPVGTGETSQLDQNDFVREPEQVPGDPTQAALGAISSGYGPLSRLGMEDIKTANKHLLSPEDILKLDGFDAQSKTMAASLLSQGVPMPQVLRMLKDKGQVIQHEGRVGRVTGSSVEDLGNLGDKNLPTNWENVLRSTPTGKNAKLGPLPGQYFIKTPEGEDLYQMEFVGGEFRGSKKLDNAPRVTTNTTLNTQGPKAGATEYFREAGNTVSELGKQARAAQDVQQGLSILKNKDAQGVFSNVTTGAATFMTSLAQIAGVPLSQQQIDKLGNTEAYNSTATEMWQKLISQFGGNRGITQQEAEQIKTILPQTKHSPQARQQLYQILDMAATRSISRFRVSNAAFVKALKSDDPEIWGQHISETLLPTTGNMPASQPNSPESYGARPAR